jgi:hypothetical protein
MMEDITYTLTIEDEDIPVRGNAMATEDHEADKAYEDEIIARLKHGDTWAWCIVKVTASVCHEGETFTGVAILGGCSYSSEDDFKQSGGYFDDMKQEAFENLVNELEHVKSRGTVASALHHTLNDDLSEIALKRA